jgi:hypothetical protein
MLAPDGRLTMIEKYLSMYLFTSIGRPVYPGYPSNFAILAVAAIAGVIAGSLRLVRSGGDIGASIATGFFMGAAVFIAWSLTREAAPDQEMAAFVSAGFAFVLSILWNVPALNLLGLAAIIVYLRLIDRVVGPPFRWIDTIGASVFVLILAWQGDWVLVFFAAAAFLLDAVLPPNPLQRHLPFAAGAALVGLFVVSRQPIQSLSLSTENLIVCGAALMAFLIYLLTHFHVRILTDAPGYASSFERVQATMIWLFLMGAVFLLFGGDAGVKTLVPLWGMFAGPPLYVFGKMIATRLEQRSVTPAAG